MPMMTLSPEEYETMQQARRDALAENEKLRCELIVARGKSGNRTIAELTSEVRLAIVVVQFAVANLPPESIKGWPWPELQAFADGLKSLPDFAISDDELRGELDRFTSECASHERRRATGMPVVPIVDADQISELTATIEAANKATGG